MATPAEDAIFAENIARINKLYEYMSIAQDKTINDAIKPALKTAAAELVALIDAYPEPTAEQGDAKKISHQDDSHSTHGSRSTVDTSSSPGATVGSLTSASIIPPNNPEPILTSSTSRIWTPSSRLPTSADRNQHQPWRPVKTEQGAQDSQPPMPQSEAEAVPYTIPRRRLELKSSFVPAFPAAPFMGPPWEANSTAQSPAQRYPKPQRPEFKTPHSQAVLPPPVSGNIYGSPWCNLTNTARSKFGDRGQSDVVQSFLASPAKDQQGELETPSFSLKDVCPCSLQGHNCPNPDGCTFMSVCVYWTKDCRCSKPHIKGTCRDWREGLPCSYGTKCWWGHDSPGTDFRKRKAEEHAGHHAQMSLQLQGKGGLKRGRSPVVVVGLRGPGEEEEGEVREMDEKRERAGKKGKVS